jgi:rRNA-processing protein EBP2
MAQRGEDIDPKLAWVETLDTCEFELEDVEDVHDDLKREVAFYNVAVSSVIAAKAKLDKAGVAYLRPKDYFAEVFNLISFMIPAKHWIMLLVDA